MGNFNAGAIEANLTLGRSDWTRDLKKTQAEIQKLENTSITIGVDLDTDNARVAMDNLELFLDDLGNNTYRPEVDLIVREAMAALEALEERLDALDARRVVVQADADTDNAVIALDNLERHMDTLENDPVTIGVDLDSADAETRLIQIGQFVNNLDNERIGIPIDVDGYSTAIAQLSTLEAQVNVLDGREIDIDIDIDRAALAGLVGSAGGDGSGGSMGLLRILIYSLIALSPILAVAMGAATAAVVGFAAAVAGAIGPVAILGAGLFGLVKRYKDLVAAGDPMPPFMQEFGDAIDAVKDAWDGFLDKIAPAGFTLMADALNLVADVLPRLVPLFNATAEMLGGVLDGVKGFVNSSEFDEMLDFFGGFGVDMLESFLVIGGNLLRFFGRLFQAIEPFARAMMSGLEDVTAGWMEWADDLENNQSFQDFMANALEYGPRVLDMLGSLVQAFMAIGDALRPFAGPMLTGLTYVFDLIANAPTDVLTAMIAALAGLWLGLSVIGPAISTVVGGITAMAGAVGLAAGPFLVIAAAVAGFIALIIYLWEENERFRNAVMATWEAIRDAVVPIIEDIVAVVMDNWGPIQAWAMEIWGSVQNIVVNAMVIIRQVVRAVMFAITFIWENFGEDIIRIVTGMVKVVGATIKGFVNILRGVFKLIKSILTGNWGDAWDAIKDIGKAAGEMIIGWLKGMADIFGGIFSAIKKNLTGLWSNLWGALKDMFSNFGEWVRERWNNLIDWFRGLGPRISAATGNLWSGFTSGFRSAINTIIGWWNNLSFSVDIPNKIPGLPDSFTISTPNLNYLAKGAYVTDPMLAVIGEGMDNEVVAPEPVLERIVRDNSGGSFDYERLAAAIASAVATVMSKVNNGLTREDLYAILSSMGVNIKVDATQDTAQLSEAIVGGLSFELRRLGFGGVRDV